MKCIALFVLALFATHCNGFHVADEHIDLRSIFDDILKNILNKFLETLKDKDPIVIPVVDFESNSDSFNIALKATDLSIAGISSLEITSASIALNPPSLAIAAQLKGLQITAPIYDLNLKALFLPFYGKGDLKLVIEDVTLDIEATAKISGLSISVKDVKVKLGLAKLNLDISGLINNEPFSDIVSTAMTECFPQFLKNYSKRIEDLLSPIVENLLNNLLQGKSAKEMFPQKGTVKEYKTLEDTRLRIIF
ncbi:hypothetical protein FQA39_LY12313 [Lamprigera yunnana]|nr:hypothetical protein FQA39_LY12313 [Lamprigera yunnana]